MWDVFKNVERQRVIFVNAILLPSTGRIINVICLCKKKFTFKVLSKFSLSSMNLFPNVS